MWNSSRAKKDDDINKINLAEDKLDAMVLRGWGDGRAGSMRAAEPTQPARVLLQQDLVRIQRTRVGFLALERASARTSPEKAQGRTGSASWALLSETVWSLAGPCPLFHSGGKDLLMTAPQRNITALRDLLTALGELEQLHERVKRAELDREVAAMGCRDVNQTRIVVAAKMKRARGFRKEQRQP